MPVPVPTNSVEGARERLSRERVSRPERAEQTSLGRGVERAGRRAEREAHALPGGEIHGCAVGAEKHELAHRRREHSHPHDVHVECGVDVVGHGTTKGFGGPPCILQR
jgi:hypothetical protein